MGGSRKENRAYQCQRCLNHGRSVCRKGHQCPFLDCTCSGCHLNNLRSKLRSVLRDRGVQSPDAFAGKNLSFSRKQHCMLCSFHGKRVELRGHKATCPMAQCECELCTIGRQYRDTMAKQVKYRRTQQKSLSNELSDSAKNSSLEPVQKSGHEMAWQDQNAHYPYAVQYFPLVHAEMANYAAALQQLLLSRLNYEHLRNQHFGIV